MEELNMEELWDYIIENNIATRDELILVSCINGYNIDTLEAVLFARTGYRNLAQIKEE